MDEILHEIKRYPPPILVTMGTNFNTMTSWSTKLLGCRGL